MGKKGNFCKNLHFFRCMRRLGEEEDMVEVDESMCDKLTKPTDINYCHVPCAGHCVVTEWSDWTHCPRVSKYFKVIKWSEWMHCPRVSIYTLWLLSGRSSCTTLE